MIENRESGIRLPDIEKEILDYWERNQTFEKSLEQRASSEVYRFYDGPPFATGTPHYGHLVASVVKDVIPRYWTMRGYRVDRKWGWDCHGLPIENIAEKDLQIGSKREILDFGIDKFNEHCRERVSGYEDAWRRTINRLGRWVDMDNAYKTMDRDYMESVWWAFKSLWEKGYVYEGYKVLNVCTRCETSLSQQEASEGYRDVKDWSATVKFELDDELGTYLLGWTTTPWTLPGNTALAISRNIEYAKVSVDNGDGHENVVIATDRIPEVVKDKPFEIVKKYLPDELIGKSYKPPFSYYSESPAVTNKEGGWKIYDATFVKAGDGTGIVHIAPAFGEDDFSLYQETKGKMPFVQHLGMDGVIKSEVSDFQGMHVKPKGNPQSLDLAIIAHLEEHGLLFSKEKYSHSYSHCWRCDTPLINFATSSWFVDIEKAKQRALELAEDIKWQPEHIKEGRFGNWLKNAHDWSISRQRFWGSVIPVWKCPNNDIKVIGSISELEDLSGEKVEDLHRHKIDGIEIECEECGSQMRRINDVLDTWFDSGSMPFAQMHYPFENKDEFNGSFPADFIGEGIDQTRAWFYYLHMISTILEDKPAYKNVIVNGIVLAEDGKKMSKKLNNYPDPNYMFEKYGADCMRYYLLSSAVLQAEDLKFSEKEVAEFSKGMFRMLWNSYSFFTTYVNIDGWTAERYNSGQQGENVLDRWILSELNVLKREMGESLDNYELTKAARKLPVFIDSLSNWYIRRSRKRFWSSDLSDKSKQEAYNTLFEVLLDTAKLMAPLTPFISEEIFRNLTGEESVHLSNYPTPEIDKIDPGLNNQMATARQLVSTGLSIRAKNKIKVRQPLSKVTLKEELPADILEVLMDELNVKEVSIDPNLESELSIDLTISEELRLEGMAREIVRNIQEQRKKGGLNIKDRIRIKYLGPRDVLSSFEELIKRETLTDEIVFDDTEENTGDSDFNIQII